MRSSRMMEVRPHLAHRELGTYDEPPGQASTLAGPVQRGEPGPEEPCGAQETGSPVPPLAGGGVASRRARLSVGLDRACAGSAPWSGTWRRGRCGRCSGCSASWPPGPCRRAGKRGGGARRAVAGGAPMGRCGKEGQGLARRRRGPAAGPVPRASTPRPLEGRLRPRGALFPGHGR